MSDAVCWQRLSALFDTIVNLDADSRRTRRGRARGDPWFALDLAGLLATDAAASDLDRGVAWLAPDAFDDAGTAVAGDATFRGWAPRDGTGCTP